MPTDLGPSIIRTIVPLLVSLLVGVLARKGIDPGPYQDLLSTVVGSLVAAAYYAAARLLETRFRPVWGWLLGLPKAPTYEPPAPEPVPAPVDPAPSTPVVSSEGVADQPPGAP